MKAEKWTPQQKEAIHTRGGNLLVAASAGAGKTSVLVQRIIGYLKDPQKPVHIDRLLVVTFTNAAAAKIREEIRKSIGEELKRQPYSRYFQRQITLLNHASIATLHSFCLEVIRQHYYQLDLDPSFRIMDEAEGNLLRSEILGELLETKYQTADNQDFLRLVDCYGGERNDLGLVELVLQLYRYAESHPWPEYWLEQVTSEFIASVERIEDYSWCTDLKAGINLQLESAEQDIQEAIRLCRDPQGPEIYLDTLVEDLACIAQLRKAAQDSWSRLYTQFQSTTFGKLKALRKKNQELPLFQQEVKRLRDSAKKSVQKMQQRMFSQAPEKHLQDMQAMAPIMLALSQTVSDFRRLYFQEKRQRGLVDFSDLEHFCVQILLQEGSTPHNYQPSDCAREMQNRFVEVLVDEYQDINGVQELILQLVSRQQGDHRPNLFLVGDVKQSIYRFRQAEPGLFLQKYRDYSTASGQINRRINLKENFRSHSAIIQGVNFLFRQIMTPQVGEIAYTQEAELVSQSNSASSAVSAGINLWADILAPEVRLYLLEKHSSEGERLAGAESKRWNTEESRTKSEIDSEIDTESEVEDEEEYLETAEMEAYWVAQQVQAFIEQKKQIWDGEAQDYRPVTYRDIAVIMRTTKGLANTFLEAFRQKGIPAYAELGSGYFAAPEVETILALLRIIDNPEQDIPFAAVLRSPLVGLDADALAQVRVCGKGKNFYGAAQNAAAQLTGIVQAQIADFLEQLEKWRTLARRSSLSSLLWEIMHKTGYYEYLGGMPGGSQRQANLRLLHNWTEKYEASSFRGLFHFLRFIQSIRESGGDIGAARTLGEQEDVVRIMSIHRSKGLEFPIVYLVGLGRRFNLLDLQGKVLVHKEQGLGPQYVNLEDAIQYPSLAKLALNQRISLETLAEEMRLLYVAMTRAKEKLCLVGTVAKLGRSCAQWCAVARRSKENIHEASLAKAKNYLDWIGPALARDVHSESLWSKAEQICPYPPWPSSEGAFRIQLVNAAEINPQIQYHAPDKQILLGKIQAGLPLMETEAESREGLSTAAEIEEIEREVQRNLTWQYPYQKFVHKRAKLTVTEVKDLQNPLLQTGDNLEVDPELELFPLGKVNFTNQPRFMQEVQGLTAAEKGTALHQALQHLDWEQCQAGDSIQEQLNELLARNVLASEQIKSVNIQAIQQFVQSELGVRLRQGNPIWRELPFNLFVSAGLVYPELGEDCPEQVLLQGSIDCLAKLPTGLVLVDYKTDWLAGPGDTQRLQDLTQAYQNQLYWYGLAVEAMFKQPVQEKYLYFFTAGIIQEVE